MGASFCTLSLPGNLSRQEVERRFSAAQDQDRHENGHSYSGGFGMADGLSFEDVEFADVNQADTWLADHCVKWEAARAVKHKTIDGTTMYLIGAWCAS